MKLLQLLNEDYAETIAYDVPTDDIIEGLAMHMVEEDIQLEDIIDELSNAYTQAVKNRAAHEADLKEAKSHVPKERSRFPKRKDGAKDVGVTKGLTIEQVLKLPTHRLLAYYKSLRKSAGYDDMESRVKKIKAELDKREHVEK